MARCIPVWSQLLSISIVKAIYTTGPYQSINGPPSVRGMYYNGPVLLGQIYGNHKTQSFDWRDENIPACKSLTPLLFFHLISLYTEFVSLHS